MNSTIYIGADHAGFDLKTSLKEHLEMQGFIVEDLGAHTLDPKDDYPQYVHAVTQAVMNHPGSLGLLSCGNAQGVCIAANKFDGIRAGLGFSLDAARTARQDDNINVLCIPGRIDTQDDPLSIADIFLQTPFSQAPRHMRRLAQVRSIETHKTHLEIVPAVLAYTKKEFVEKLGDTKIRNRCPLFQVDVLDGSMFNATCFHEADAALSVTQLPDIELHLMIQDPLSVIDAWRHVPTLKRAIVHAEINQDLLPIIQRIKNDNLQVGIALNPDTPLEVAERFAPLLDLLLLMGVQAGASGQPFLGAPIIEKIQDAKHRFPGMKLAIDGGVTEKNVHTLIESGIDQLCVGSAIWNSADPIRTITSLQHAGEK